MPSKKKTPAKKKAPPVAAAATCSALTVDILKTLKFGLRTHRNGGENYSARIVGNDEYGLYVTTHTDGSPNYRITEKLLGVDDTEEITLDLMAKERDLQGFCDAYNYRANITCDICKREMHQRGWEDTPQRLAIVTNCTSQNPMERITQNSQFQANTYIAEDVCQGCMKSLARIIADGIESLANAKLSHEEGEINL